jgi:hypothetical protein
MAIYFQALLWRSGAIQMPGAERQIFIAVHEDVRNVGISNHASIERLRTGRTVRIEQREAGAAGVRRLKWSEEARTR